MPNATERVLALIDSRRERSLEGLLEFLRIPSVSTKPEHKPDVARCAEWLALQLVAAGLTTTIHPTPGHPIVLARNAHIPGRPTVLLYGHYDVQPPEPLELWVTPPFAPTIRNDEAGFPAVFARGAVDDKGQVWCHVQALLAWHENGGVPVNLIVLIEGEEEIGSDNLADFVTAHAAALRADIAVISDTNQFARGVPAVTYGLRGLCYMEIFLTGPSHDLHSGLYGGAVPNPANILSEVLASLHDSSGRVTIPGFYDDVIPLTETERAAWRKLPFTEAEFATSVGIAAGVGEAGYTSLERKWARPTLDVNGLTSGYQGAGAKTVIPSKASAKLSMRLVPNQRPAKIQALFEQAIRGRCPAGVKLKFAQHGLADPALVPIDSEATRLAARRLKLASARSPRSCAKGGAFRWSRC